MRNYDLSVRGREERGCLRADLAVDGTVLHIFNVHLGTAFLERRTQARRLIAPELLNDAEIQSPRIVMGDFNEWTQGLATRLLRSHLVSADFRAHLQRFAHLPRRAAGLPPGSHLLRPHTPPGAPDPLAHPQSAGGIGPSAAGGGI